MPEVHGRADTLFGSVVFEFKSDLRHELPDVFAQLPGYIGDRERQTGSSFHRHRDRRRDLYRL